MSDALNDDEIESILDGGDEILPSSGFAESVMEAVHRDVITLPPLAFPWRRAVPGIVALLAAFWMAIWRFIVALNNGDVQRSPRRATSSTLWGRCAL
jgi:hypothetical protein